MGPGTTLPVDTIGVSTANSNGEYVVASTTLMPGGPAVIVSGSAYSLATDGSSLVVDGATTSISRSTGGSGSSHTASPSVQPYTGGAWDTLAGLKMSFVVVVASVAVWFGNV